MNEAPAPPTPAEADLRGMPYMPFKGDRAFTSTTWVTASPEGRCAALRLWWHSFAKEVPAGSLPDDDRLLAEYAGYGVAIKAWLKIKGEAMRGWFKCSDGRLYHNVVAEVVAEAWETRREHEERRRAWREKKRRKAGLSPEISQGKTGEFPQEVPGENALKGSEGKGIPPTPRKNSRAHGTNPRAHAPRHVGGNGASAEPGHRLHLPPDGFRVANLDDRVAYGREKFNDNSIDIGHWRLPEFVPIGWKPKGA